MKSYLKIKHQILQTSSKRSNRHLDFSEYFTYVFKKEKSNKNMKRMLKCLNKNIYLSNRTISLNPIV